MGEGVAPAARLFRLAIRMPSPHRTRGPARCTSTSGWAARTASAVPSRDPASTRWTRRAVPGGRDRWSARASSARRICRRRSREVISTATTGARRPTYDVRAASSSGTAATPARPAPATASSSPEMGCDGSTRTSPHAHPAHFRTAGTITHICPDSPIVSAFRRVIPPTDPAPARPISGPAGARGRPWPASGGGQGANSARPSCEAHR
ncbi:hypothetical protein ACFQVA_21300 [Actinomadura keratinilytica]